MVILYSILIFILGSLLTSFFQLIALRLPNKESIMGRSYCPHCHHSLRLMDVMPMPGALYIALTGLFWTLILLAVALNLWFGWKWVPLTTAAVLLFYSIYYWLDWFVLQSAQPRLNGPFSLVLTILYLFFTALALGLPGSRKFFNRQKRVI